MGKPATFLRHAHAVNELALPQTKAKITDMGFHILGNTREEFTALIRSQIELVSRIAKSARIQPFE